MIIFDLICNEGHIFEGWFSSSIDFEDQKENGLLSCPSCGSNAVGKSVMAPNLGLKANQKSPQSQKTPQPLEGGKQSLEPVVQKANIAKTDDHDGDKQLTNTTSQLSEVMEQKMVQALSKLQDKVLQNSDWVGGKFAQEARAIHYGETEKRQIHGHATENEASELSEEGIDIAALPMPYIPPDMKN